MNREERLRAALDGTGIEDRAADLATLPAAQVDLIVSAIKASGRAALVRDQDRRRQRREDRRKYNHIEDDQQAGACERPTLTLARRAGSNLGTLDRLKEHYDDGPRCWRWQWPRSAPRATQTARSGLPSTAPGLRSANGSGVKGIFTPDRWERRSRHDRPGPVLPALPGGAGLLPLSPC